MNNNAGSPSDGKYRSKRRRQSKHDIDFLLGRPPPPTPPPMSTAPETHGSGEHHPVVPPLSALRQSSQLPPLAPHARHLALPGASGRPQAVHYNSSRMSSRADLALHGLGSAPAIAPATLSSSHLGSIGAGASSSTDHAASHPSRIDRPFVCDVCGFSFSQKSDRAKHRKAVHVKDRPFQCEECSAGFAFHDGLQRHITMVHLSKRPHKCTEPGCDMAFKQKAHAEKHMASVHRKLRPCVCFCGAAFRENYNLKQHQRSVHNMDV